MKNKTILKIRSEKKFPPFCNFFIYLKKKHVIFQESVGRSKERKIKNTHHSWIKINFEYFSYKYS